MNILNINVKHSLKLLFLLFIVNCSFLSMFAEDNTIYATIGNAYTSAFPLIEEPIIKKEESTNTIELSRNEARKKIFPMLSQAPLIHCNDGFTVNKNLWKDLDLFTNPGEHTSRSVFSKINRTTTLAGEATLASMLVLPSIERRNVVKALITNDLLFQRLNSYVQEQATYESSIIQLLMNEGTQNSFYKLYFYWPHIDFNNNYFNKANSYVINFTKKLNKNSIMLGLRNEITYLERIIGPFLYFITTTKSFARNKMLGRTGVLPPFLDAGTPITLDPNSSLFAEMKEIVKSSALDALTFYTLRKIMATLKGTQKRDASFYVSLLGEPLALWSWFLSIKNYFKYLREDVSYFKDFKQAFNKVHSYIRATKETMTFLAETPSFPFELFVKIHSCEEHIKKLDDLYELFEKNYKGIFKTGNELALYNLLWESKENLISVIQLAGLLDAYLSIAKLYKEHRGKNATYSLVNFVDNQTPLLEAHNFWNPLIDPNVVVTNTMSLGVKSPRNAIITGPNAGGKSTVITGLALVVLLAHSFGIAPAQSCTMTPFAYLNTYLNIADDRAAGKSLFMAEVERAKALYNSIQNLKPRQFSFTIMDELFSGTNAVEGEAAAYSVAKSLGSFDKSICLLATHFPKVTELEVATSRFKNYKVSVIKHDDGRLEYPFLLQEGITNQAIALDILQQQGFSSSILDDAYALVKDKKNF